MVSINNIVVSGKVVNTPNKFVADEINNGSIAIFNIRNDIYISGVKKASYTLTIKCYENIAEYVDAEISAGDWVLVTGTLSSGNRSFRGGYINFPYVRALSVTRLDQEKYI